MNITLYKFLALNDNTTELDFYNTRVLTENELRNEFLERYQDNSFIKENLMYYSISTNKDLSIQDVYDMDIATIIDCFNDNGNYDTDNIFLLEQITVDVDEYNDCYD